MVETFLDKNGLFLRTGIASSENLTYFSYLFYTPLPLYFSCTTFPPKLSIPTSRMNFSPDVIQNILIKIVVKQLGCFNYSIDFFGIQV